MIYDIIIIGAGPCGLAVAARLRQKTPSALFTDAEHARYWSRHKCVHTVEREARQKRREQRYQQQRMSDDGKDHEIEKEDPPRQDCTSMLVLDATSTRWMSTWHSRFESLKITHLRSPLFFHCDPRDRDGLLEYSHTQFRTHELNEINNVVGRETSKHHTKKGKKRRVTRHLCLDNRDRIDYHTPSASLFHDHSQYLVERYDLNNVVQKATVTSIKYEPTSIATEANAMFTLTTTTGQIFLARTVVVATGSGKTPSIPADYKFLNYGSASHIFDHTSTLLSSHLEASSDNYDGRRPRRTTIAVIGGGLTSAQLVSLLLTQHGIDKVHLILRSKLKVKYFDVDLEWVTKYRNANMARFWSADTDDERVEMLRSSRNGGSMPPKWAKLLRGFEKDGRLCVWENSKVVDGRWHRQGKVWDLDVDTASTDVRLRSRGDYEGVSHGERGRHILTDIDHVVCATGLASGLDNVDFLKTFNEEHPITSIGGFPQLDHDLKWDSEVPLFLTGALAGLRLGPGAGNLAGARLGAERVAWGVEKVLEKKTRMSTCAAVTPLHDSRKHPVADSAYWSSNSSIKDDADGSDDEGPSPTRAYSVTDRSEFTGGFSNQFEALAV